MIVLVAAREGTIVVPGPTSGWWRGVSPVWFPPLAGMSWGGGGAAPNADLLGGSSASGAGWLACPLSVLRPLRSLARGVGRGVAGGGVWLGAAGRWRGGWLVGWLVEFIAR